MTSIIRIEDIASHTGEEVTLQGWLQLKTGKGKLQFLRVRDGTGFIQAVIFKGNVSEEVFEAAKRMPLESSLVITGNVRADDRAPGIPGGYELDVTGLEVGDAIHISAVALPQGAESAITDRDFTIATVVAPSALKQAESAAGEDAPAEAAAAEPEEEAAGDESEG